MKTFEFSDDEISALIVCIDDRVRTLAESVADNMIVGDTFDVYADAGLLAQLGNRLQGR